jgi:hypothetical protein
MRVGGQRHTLTALTREGEAGLDPGSVWTDVENLAPTGIQSSDRPACNESLYRLSYRGP